MRAQDSGRAAERVHERHAVSPPTNMKPPLRIAIVGTGFLATTRARCWRRVHGVAVEAIAAARDAAKAEAFARAHGLLRGTTIDAALADPAVVLADLCVANAAHRDLCERAAAAGKHVLCTKPLAVFCGQDLPKGAGAEQVAATDRATMLRAAVGDGEAMVAACARAGRRLFYGENWLFAPTVRRAAALGAAAPGVVLEMRGWESHSGSHSQYAKDWRHAGGGALLRLGAHPIGAMLWLKRREGLRRRGRPTQVVAVTAEVADLSLAAADTARHVATGWQGVENWGTCVLHFDDGTRGVAYGSDNMLGGMQSHLTVLASDHRLECALSPTDALRAYAPAEGAFGSEYLMEKLHGQAGWSTPMPDEDWSSGQQDLVQAVARELAGGERIDADGELGLEVVRVVYTAYVSAATGRRTAIAR
jgi:predicted dehydrogenase